MPKLRISSLLALVAVAPFGVTVERRTTQHRRSHDENKDHTLNGPIFVNGAEPGDVLEIRILSLLTSGCR